MRYKTHRSLGILGYLITIGIILPFPAPFLSLIGIPIVSKVSTLPDELDSWLGVKHRGFTHTIFAALITTALVSILLISLHYHVFSHIISVPLSIIVFSVFCGYFFHVIADAFTDNGVYLFWPLYGEKKRKPIYRLWYYSSGKGKEEILRYLAYSLAVIICLFRIFIYTIT